MESNYLKQREGALSELISVRTYNRAMPAVILFILANAVKLSLFNNILLANQSLSMFSYKLIFTTLALIIIYPVILGFKSKYVFILTYILQIVYILVNLSYFLYFHSFLQIIQWISLFKEGFISTMHSSNPQNIKILVAFIDLPFAVYLVLKYYKMDAERLNSRIVKKSTVLVAAVLFIFIEISNYYSGTSLLHYSGSESSKEADIVQRYGTVVNSFVNIANNLTEEQMVGQLKYGKEISGSALTDKKPNFVLIQVESLDANVINKKYNGEYVAPFLHNLSEKNVYYPYVLSYHKGGGTSDSEFSILNSIESLDSFPAIKLSSYDYPNSLVSKLSDSGYKTMAFHGNAGTFYNRDTSLPKMGFQDFYDIDKMGMENVGWGAPDCDVFNFAYDTFSNSDKPFFSYVITMTSHGPFTNASNYYNNSIYNDIEDQGTRNYLNSISYVDKSLQDFVSKIQANLDNTYIIIYGDHTPNVNTDTYKQASFSMDNRYFEFVPLLVVTPDGMQYTEKSKVASFLDISPTVLKASGIQYEFKSDGQNLLAPGDIKNRIPYRDDLYNRKYLFNIISKNK